MFAPGTCVTTLTTSRAVFTAAAILIGAAFTSTHCGPTWRNISNDLPAGAYRMFDVLFPSPDTGYAVGRSDASPATNDALSILRTTNGGAAWTPMFQAPLGMEPGDFGDLHFTSSRRGYALRKLTASVRTTTDAGISWENMTLPVAAQSLAVLDDTTLVISATDFHGRKILRSANAGSSWDTTHVPAQVIHAFDFPSAAVGYGVGANGSFLKTVNGGQTWGQPAVAQPDTLLQWVEVRCVDTLTCLAAGYWALPGNTAIPVKGELRRTTDGGATWTSVFSGTSPLMFRAVHCPTALACHAAGASGFMARSADGGATWTLDSTGLFDESFSVYFTSDTVGYAVGSKGGSGVLLRYVNGSTAFVGGEGRVTTEPHRIAMYGNILAFHLDAAVPVSLRLLDMQGRTVWRRDEGLRAPGAHRVPLPFNGNSVQPKGLHLLDLRAGTVRHTLRVLTP